MFANAFTLAVAALAFCGTSTAHMIMRHPVPFNNLTINNSPLRDVKPTDPRSDFPCKVGKSGPAYDKTGIVNNFKVGDTQQLSFEGSASHGGGTCQLAVSLDEYPTATSVWKIIQVYEGGCPTTGDGNDGSNVFTFSIPKQIPNGQSTLAWIWYNKVGNREVYMNCAPLTITGGSDSKDAYNTLPNAYVINLPTTECSTVENTDQEIPYPGEYLKVLQNTLAAANGSMCGASKAAQTQGVSGGASLYGSGSTSASAPGSSSAEPTSAAGYGGAGLSSASVPVYTSGSSSSIAAPAYTPAVSSSSQAPESSFFPSMTPTAGEGIYGPATTATSVAAPAGTGSSSSGILCDAAHAGQYGQIVNGKAVWRTVAAGTTCSEVQQYRKRSALRHAHVRRHVQNAAIRHAA